MPEININVKVIGGKRTELKIAVERRSLKEKATTLNTGHEISTSGLEEVIFKAVVDYCTGKGGNRA